MPRTPEDMALHLVFPMPAIQLKFRGHHKYTSIQPPAGTRCPDDWLCDVYTTYPSIADDDTAIAPEMLAELKADMAAEIGECFEALGIRSQWSFKNFWYNSYQEGQGQEGHDHLGGGLTHWCGIYYNVGSQPTTFERPDSIYRCHAHPTMTQSRLGYLFEREWIPQVSEGDILLFPPYVRHMVPRQPPGASRLTFSFNIAFPVDVDGHDS